VAAAVGEELRGRRERRAESRKQERQGNRKQETGNR
jgi:hypothetical protein